MKVKVVRPRKVTFPVFVLCGFGNGAGQAGGVLDELATFNCPLAQADVIAGYPQPAILAQPVSVTVNIIKGSVNGIDISVWDGHSFPVAPKVRIQYPGAVYQMMNRGGRCDPV